MKISIFYRTFATADNLWEEVLCQTLTWKSLVSLYNYHNADKYNLCKFGRMQLAEWNRQRLMAKRYGFLRQIELNECFRVFTYTHWEDSAQIIKYALVSSCKTSKCELPYLSFLLEKDDMPTSMTLALT